MRSWRERVPFYDLLAADPDVGRALPGERLSALFDYGFYLENVGATFERLGL
jgi:hypothetical protein